MATAASGRGALAALRREPFDLVLTDLKMPDLSGIVLLEEILREQPGTCVVLMTAHGSIDSAVEAMRKGAFDYLTKPVDREVLLLAVSRAVERTRLVSENRRLREELRGRFRVENLVGAHGSMQEVFRVVHKVARSRSTVLIYGESGTGKELVARAIHVTSDRRDRPFVAVNWPRCPRPSSRRSCSATRRAPSPGPTRARSASSSRPPVDPLPRRGRRADAGPAGEAAAHAAGAGGAPRGRHRARAGRRPRRRGHEPRPRARGPRGTVPRGPLLPPQRHPHRAPAAARAADRHPAPRRALPRQARRARAHRGGSPPRRSRRLVAYSWPGNVRELESAVERTLLLADGDVVRLDDLPPAVRMRSRALAARACRSTSRTRAWTSTGSSARLILRPWTSPGET